MSVGINKKILRLAVPAIFNNITVPLLGLSDTAISGHLGSEAFLAAMAVGATMFNVIFMLCGFLRMGTTGLAAQANGARDEYMARDVLRKALIIAGLISILVLFFQRPLELLLLKVISPDTKVIMYASQYFGIVVWSVPAQLGTMAVSGWFIGRQNTFIPMCIAVGINVVNIAASIIFVFLFGLGFKGVALGTLISNWLGLAAILICLRLEFIRNLPGTVPDNDYRNTSDLHAAQLHRVKWSTFFNVNGNLFFRSACIMAVSLSMTAIGAGIDDVTLAANSVMLQFFLFFSYFMDGFAFAGEALVGNAAGAGDARQLRRTVIALLKWGGILAVLFSVIYMMAGNLIVSLLTDSASVLDEVIRMKLWLVALPLITVSAFIFDGVFIGLARTAPLLTVTLAGTALFFLIVYMGRSAAAYDPNRVLWTAFETYLLVRGVLLAIKYLILQRKSLTL